MDFGLLTHLISWDIYIRIFNFLFEYGFYYIPLIILGYQNYFAQLDGDKNTSIAAVSINRMFISVLIYVFIFFIAVLPTIDVVQLEDLKKRIIPNIESTHLSTDNLNKRSKAMFDNFKQNQTETPKTPLIFGGYDFAQYAIIGGVKNIVAELPINDIRSSILTTMQNDAIKTPRTRRNYNNFATQCFYPAKNRFDKMVDAGDITPDTGWFDLKQDIPESSYDWVGGSYYMQNNGFYLPCRNSKEGACKTYSGLRFMLQNESYACAAGWDWLYPQLKQEFNIDKMFTDKTKAPGSAGSESLKKQAVRSFLKAEQISDEEEGNGYGIVAALKSVVGWVVGMLGAGATALLKLITTYLIILIIPLVQALLLFVIVVILPIILPFSAFKVEYLISIFASMFAIQFVTVIVAIISIIDNSLLTLYSAGSGSDNGFMQAVHIAGSKQGFEFFLINLLILFFYLIAIKIWFGFMVSFGSQAKDEISSVKDMGISSTGVSGAKSAAKKFKEFASGG